jgi:hypothetical protein
MVDNNLQILLAKGGAKLSITVPKVIADELVVSFHTVKHKQP